MALPKSGTISLNQVNVELKKSATAKISLGDTAVRKLAGRTSGSISMSHLYGKAFEITVVNSTNRTQANIHTIMGSPTAVGDYIFENTGTISAASRGGWALQTGVFPAGSTLRIINRGAIRGGGGNGGNASHQGMPAGGAGGSALVLNFPATIDNRGTIWGGGGGGGGLQYGDSDGAVYYCAGGGGAGMPAGAGGTGVSNGRTVNGKAGTATSGGAGGKVDKYAGGAGGGPGATGGRSDSKSPAGGRGGYSVQRNGHAVTWTAVGDRKGSVV